MDEIDQWRILDINSCRQIVPQLALYFLQTLDDQIVADLMFHAGRQHPVNVDSLQGIRHGNLKQFVKLNVN